MTERTKRGSAFLLGRKTYEIFAGSWPKSTDPADEIATALNTWSKFVASRTLDTLAWHNSHLLKGDVAEEVARLKAKPFSCSHPRILDLTLNHAESKSGDSERAVNLPQAVSGNRTFF